MTKSIWLSDLTQEQINTIVTTQMVNPFCRREIVLKKSMYYHLGYQKNVCIGKNKKRLKCIDKFFCNSQHGGYVFIVNLEPSFNFNKNWLKFYSLFKAFSVGYFFVKFEYNVIQVTDKQDWILLDFLSPILRRRFDAHS